MAKYSSKEIYCGVTMGVANSHMMVNIPVSGPHNSIARYSIRIYFGDIRNTSLADLHSRKVPVQIDYEIWIGQRSSKTANTTSDNIVPTLKHFSAELDSCL